MAVNSAKLHKFVEMRAEGVSLREISKEIKVSKPTLIKWSREHKEKIENFTKLIEEQFLAEERLKRTTRAKHLSNELDKAYSELGKSDYRDMTKKEIINLIEKLEKKLDGYTKQEYLIEPEKFKILITRHNIGSEAKEATIVKQRDE